MIDLIHLIKNNNNNIEEKDEPFLPEFYHNVGIIRRELSNLKVLIFDLNIDFDKIDGVISKINRLLISIKENSNEPEGIKRIKFNIRTALMNSLIEISKDYYKIKHNYEEITKDSHVICPEESPIYLYNQEMYDQIYQNYLFAVWRYKEILKLEKSLDEVHQLFVDMAALVEQQGEVIDRIAYRIANAKANVQIAKEDLTITYNIKKRRTTCIIQ